MQSCVFSGIERYTIPVKCYIIYTLAAFPPALNYIAQAQPR